MNKIYVYIPLLDNEDKVEALRAGADIRGKYIMLSAQDDVRNVIDAKRVSVEVENVEDDYDYTTVWHIYVHNLYDEHEGLNDRGGIPLAIAADVLRYMTQQKKDSVDEDVMKYIYQVQDARIKEILRSRYEPKLKELKEELTRLEQEKAKIEQRMTELSNEITKIEKMIS